jgi:hypothetical protein
MAAAPSSLCPGYKQVEAFGPDEEYEDEEEVFYVTLDMGNIEPTLVPSSSSYRLIVSLGRWKVPTFIAAYLDIGIRHADTLSSAARDRAQRPT